MLLAAEPVHGSVHQLLRNRHLFRFQNGQIIGRDDRPHRILDQHGLRTFGLFLRRIEFGFRTPHPKTAEKGPRQVETGLHDQRRIILRVRPLRHRTAEIGGSPDRYRRIKSGGTPRVVHGRSPGLQFADLKIVIVLQPDINGPGQCQSVSVLCSHRLPHGSEQTDRRTKYTISHHSFHSLKSVFRAMSFTAVSALSGVASG